MTLELVGSERGVDQLLVSKRPYDIIKGLIADFVCKNAVNRFKKICTPNFFEQAASPTCAADKKDI